MSPSLDCLNSGHSRKRFADGQKLKYNTVVQGIAGEPNLCPAWLGIEPSRF